MDALQALVQSEARAKVLTALFSERGRSFYQKELERATGLRLVAVQRQLRRLTAAGLVTRTVAGGRRLYTADTKSAIYEEISGIVRKLRGPASFLRSAIAGRRDIDLAFVFGSFATGNATASSDVDLIVLGDESPRVVRTALARAERDLGRSVNEYVITVKEWKGRLRKADPFIGNVRQERKLWVRGDEDALAKLDVRHRKR